MPGTKLNWINGPWRGRLAVAARPRGGDWLEDEIAAWQLDGIGVLVSLLMPDEMGELGLQEEGKVASEHGMLFRSFGIVDRDVPDSTVGFAREVEAISRELAAGKNVVVHCRQGVGRAGLTASALLMREGMDAQEAVDRVSEGRGIPVPETGEQMRWLEAYSQTLEPAAR